MASKGKKAPAQDQSSWAEFVHWFKANPFIAIGTIFVLIIVVVAFVLVPAIVPNSGRSTDLVFGVYDKIPIAYVPGNYFAQTFDRVVQYYRSMRGDDFNYMSDYQCWYETYQFATVRTAILQEMKKAKYLVPEKAVDREVALLYQENGRFSPRLYRKVDNNTRLAQWRQMQESLTIQHYTSDFSKMIQPQAQADFISNMASPVRSFDMTFFEINDYPDSELVSFAREHSDLFVQTHLSMITVSSSEREAKKILGMIKDETETFEDIARMQSKDEYADRGGDMGIKPAYELVSVIPDEAAREKIIALQKDEYSEVIKLEAGWAFFMAMEDAQALDLDDPLSLGGVRSYIQTFERGQMEDWAERKAQEFIAQVGKDGFAAAIAKNGLTKRSFGPLPLNYGDVDLFEKLSSFSIPELYGASTDELFWKAAFSTEVNTPSQPITNGSYKVVLFPTSEASAEESEIGRIESLFSSGWLSNASESAQRTYFMKSSKMEDRFTETFMRYFMPSYN